MSDKLFGYVECDISVPEHLYEKKEITQTNRFNERR
jgi:hypothetical protein